MKEKMLRAAREKGRVTHKRKPIRLTADLSAETLQARREPALQELLKEALHVDGNNQYQPFQKHTKRLECSGMDPLQCTLNFSRLKQSSHISIQETRKYWVEEQGSAAKTPPSSLETTTLNEKSYSCFPTQMLLFPKSPWSAKPPYRVPLKNPTPLAEEQSHVAEKKEEKHLKDERSLAGDREEFNLGLLSSRGRLFPPHPFSSSPSYQKPPSSLNKISTFIIPQFSFGGCSFPTELGLPRFSCARSLLSASNCCSPCGDGTSGAMGTQSRTHCTEKRRAGQKSRAGDPGGSFAGNLPVFGHQKFVCNCSIHSLSALSLGATILSCCYAAILDLSPPVFLWRTPVPHRAGPFRVRCACYETLSPQRFQLLFSLWGWDQPSPSIPYTPHREAPHWGAGKTNASAKRVALATHVSPLPGISRSVGNKKSSENFLMQGLMQWHVRTNGLDISLKQKEERSKMKRQMTDDNQDCLGAQGPKGVSPTTVQISQTVLKPSASICLFENAEFYTSEREEISTQTENAEIVAEEGIKEGHSIRSFK
ncbi:LINE-1 retrotransposable element ORF1 protein, partial [Plecturocebus cupreus]